MEVWKKKKTIQICKFGFIYFYYYECIHTDELWILGIVEIFA